jgi:hypothetical protein
MSKLTISEAAKLKGVATKVLQRQHLDVGSLKAKSYLNVQPMVIVDTIYPNF